jgi:hypothetical protein
VGEWGPPERVPALSFGKGDKNTVLSLSVILSNNEKKQKKKPFLTSCNLFFFHGILLGKCYHLSISTLKPSLLFSLFKLWRVFVALSFNFSLYPLCSWFK